MLHRWTQSEWAEAIAILEAKGVDLSLFQRWGTSTNPESSDANGWHDDDDDVILTDERNAWVVSMLATETGTTPIPA